MDSRSLLTLARRLGGALSHLTVLPRPHDRRTGGAAEPGCTLSQISRFNSISSAASASAKARAGMRERNAVGLSSVRGHVLGRCTNGVASRRCEKAFHSGVAPASYWLSDGRPRICSMERKTEAVV